METFASGAWSALGNAWRGGTDFVQRYNSLLYLFIYFYTDPHGGSSVCLVTDHCSDGDMLIF